MFLPENIDLAQSEKYILSIRLTPNGFSFCIFSPVDKSVFYYRPMALSRNLSILESIKKIFFEINVFSQPFRKTVVTVVSPKFTTVPDAFFEKNRAKDIFEFNVQGPVQRILTDHIEPGNYNLLYSIDEEIYSFLSRNLWSPDFRSFTACLLPFFSAYRSETGRRCFVDFHDGLVTAICFSGNQLLSVNTYSGKDRYDALYYIASVWEKHPLDQNSDRLILSGNLEGNRESVDTLSKLIRNTEVIKPTPRTILPQSIGYLPTDVLLQLCG